MLTDEVKAFAHQAVNLEELGRNEDSDGVFVVELGAPVLHNGRALFFFSAVLVALLYFQLPRWRNAVANRSLELLLIGLLLFVLFHGEDVVQEPLEDGCVAVNRNIDLVVVTDLFQAAIEILHVFNEKASGKGKIALLVLAVVDHVDHDAILEFEVLALEHFEATFVVAETA